MAKIKASRYQTRQFGGAVPFGNVTSLVFPLATASNGGVINADTGAAVASGDVIDLGQLPEGMRLEDLSVFVTVGMTASVTGSVGFEYEDGVDSTEVPQDSAYFISAGNINTAGRLRANTGKLVTLPKPARLILTTGGAANAKASNITFVVHGELTGPR